MLPTPRIHFLETLGNVWQLPGSPEMESGYWWRFGKKNAQELIGGHIYLHESQAAPSHEGGVITGYRIQEEGKYKGRYIFRFRPSPDRRGIIAEPGRWSYRYKQLVL